MKSAECSLDVLLCQALLQYRQYRLYDAHECEEKAYRILKETRVLIKNEQNGVDVAKWGCVVECLAQKYYIESNTDEVLKDIDIALITFWKKVEKTTTEAFPACLWLGYYFLLRFRDKYSRCHSRSKQVMTAILTFMIDEFHRIEKETVPMNLFGYFSADVWSETVLWVEQVYDSGLCQKQSAAVLQQLYNLKLVDLPQSFNKHNVLLQHILEFYCF